jgi:putative ABC transport system permease protein
MFRNNLKSATRFLLHNRVFAAINMMSLAIALSVSFVILLYVINELSYDRCHHNRKNVYRVVNHYKDFKKTMAGTPYALAKALKEEFPQIVKATNTNYIRGLKLMRNQEMISVKNAVATDSEISAIFTLKILAGDDPQHMLDDMNSIMLSSDLSSILFPGQSAVGKEIIGEIDGSKQMFVVSGIFDNIPSNSTFRAQCLVNSKWSVAPVNKTFNITNAETSWDKDFWNTWILLSDEAKVSEIEKQLRQFEIKYISENPHNEYRLQNLPDVYLGSGEIMNSGITGNPRNVRLFSVIALLIIVVASINYIILSTAVSTGRVKEMGIRKMLGADNRSIRRLLMNESVLLACIVLPVSVVLAWISLPLGGKLFQTDLIIIPSNIPLYIAVYAILTVSIGLISGIYTTTYLSGLNIIEILQNKWTGRKKQYLRSLLIIIQLMIFCAFVSATLIIRSQYRYLMNKDTGYYTNDILILDLGSDFKGYSSFINSIRSFPDVISAAGVMEALPMSGSGSFMFPNFQDPSVKVEVEGLAVDYGFINTMGIKILNGREFSTEFGNDLNGSVMLNETAVKNLSITDPVGKKFGNSSIIGIVKDFNLHSLHRNIPPLVINMTDKYIHQIAVRYKPGTLNNLLPRVEAEWKKVAPERHFSYSTIEDLIRQTYSSEKNLNTIVTVASLFTLLIAAAGLFGLILFVARSRTKEIGIRKVFGSSGQSIINSFLVTNLFLVIIAGIASVPITVYFMNKWLQAFSFRISITFWFFFAGSLIASIVVLSTVYFHARKVSRINPVKALKEQ